MVRAFDRVHLMELDGLDLAFAQREMFESAVAMGRAALQGGRASTPARSNGSSANIAVRDCERLERQSQTGDLHAGEERSLQRRTVTARR